LNILKTISVDIKFQKFVTTAIFFAILLTHFTSLKTGIAHNTSSNILPGIAPHYDLGLPYVNYNVIYPPGLYLFYYGVGSFDINTALFYKYIHFALVIIFTTVNFYIFNKIKIPAVYFLLATVVLLSPEVIFYTLPNDLLVSTMVSVAFACLIFFKNDREKFLTASLFFMLAGLTKDYYLTLLIIPYFYLLRKFSFKNFVYILCGNFFAFTIVAIYVVNLNLTKYVIDLYRFKFVSYFVEFIWLLPILLLIFLFFLLTGKVAEVSRYVEKIQEDLVFVYLYLSMFFFLYMGFEIYGEYKIRGHHAIPFTYGFFVLVYFIIKKIVREESYKVSVYFILFYFIFNVFILTPRNSIFDSYTNEGYLTLDTSNFQNSPIHNYPLDISNLLDENPNYRLYVAFGWGGPDFYLEKLIQPYSRLWIMQYRIIPNFDDEIAILKNKFIQDPPEVLEYCGLSDYCPVDMDYLEFEERYIPYGEIVTNCYKDLKNNFYLLENKECVKNLFN
jgi:hypothetical protein